jgi:uncharacterized membrane protein YfcA
MEQRISNGTSLAAVIPIAISGAISYASLGQIDWQAVVFVLSGAVIGAAYCNRTSFNLVGAAFGGF